MRTKDLVDTAMYAAIICILAPISLPIGEIPISLATFAVYIVAVVGGPKRGTFAVFIYILIGAVGMPVFAGFSGGFQKLAGVTGGFIIGYIPCALVIGYLCEKIQTAKCELKKRMIPLTMAIGTIICYTFGTIWFMLQTGNDVISSLVVCVAPFIPGDIVKIAASSAVAPSLKMALGSVSDGIKS